jgi:hypothetical protein
MTRGDTNTQYQPRRKKMKAAKVAILASAVIALAATDSPAGQYKVTLGGIVYTNVFNTIYPYKLANKDVISLCTTNKGAQLVYDTSGESNGSGTNLMIVVDKCGTPVCPIALLILNQATCTSETTGRVEKVCSIPVEFVSLGGAGTVVIDLKKLVTTKGTNVVGKGSGVFIGLGNPGVLTISINGAFKPSTSGCP